MTEGELEALAKYRNFKKLLLEQVLRKLLILYCFEPYGIRLK